MRTTLQVLSEEEKNRVHQRSLEILADTGLRVDTNKGRQILKSVGAEVDESTKRVRFPRHLIEEALLLAPKEFSLGARRPRSDLKMNAGNCTLIADGEGMFVIDWKTGERRSSTFDDWLKATQMIDALDEIGVYWSIVERSDIGVTPADMIYYYRNLFSNFSKHVQDATPGAEYSPWLLEVLQVIFGDKESIRKKHPFSFLLCPQSPLVIDQQFTDAYLALLGWYIPVAIMPMPLMGGTAPGSLISTVILGNCEVLAMLCLIQSGAPGTPVIYAPVLAISNPRTGGYSAGAIESGLLGAATTEMSRYYGLPVEASGGGSSQYIPNIQASYERALNGMIPVLSWPDLLVGPGLLGGSTHLCMEQMLIDIEVFKMSRRVHQGISTGDEKWLEDVIQEIGPAGHFLGERSTIQNLRSGELYLSEFGWQGSYEDWKSSERANLLAEVSQKVDSILENYQPIPLSEDMERELDYIYSRAQNS